MNVPAIRKLKTTAKIDIARQNSKESARIVQTQGAFGCRMKILRTHPEDTSTRNALARIIGDGEKVMVKSLIDTGAILPSNWGGNQLVHEIDGGISWKGWFSVSPEVFETAARRSGWMKAMGLLIAEHPAWFARASKALAKCPSRGMNSPSNNCWTMVQFLTGSSVERWRTPGHAFRAISSGISRAKGILKGFNVTNVPWTVVMDELAASRGPQRGGKIGRRLALKTLSHLTKVHTGNRAIDFVKFKGFRHDEWRTMTPEAQEFYRMKMREGFKFDEVILPPIREDDGVKIFVLSKTIVRRHVVIEGLVALTSSRRSGKTHVVGLRKQTLITSPDNRTFHLNWTPSEIQREVKIEESSWAPAGGEVSKYLTWQMSVPQGHESVGHTLSGSTRFWQRFAIRLAEQAWRTQDSLAKAEGLELPTDRSILVWLEDSYSAGNCVEGTQAFKNQYGWGNRLFVPTQWLLDKESRARNAAKVALARYWASQVAHAA